MLLVIVITAITVLTVAQLWCLRPGTRRESALRMITSVIAVSFLFRVLAALVFSDLDSEMSTIVTAFAVLAAIFGITFAAVIRRMPRFAGRGRIVALVIGNALIINCVAGAGLMILYGAAVSKGYGG